MGSETKVTCAGTRCLVVVSLVNVQIRITMSNQYISRKREGTAA